MYSILYVDDEPGLLEIAKIFLEQDKDFSVDTDTSAAHAIDPIGAKSYDAIISDYQMPGMDGIEFLKAVRQKYGDIPFILFTGRGREEVVIEAINNGADFYLQKGGDPRAQFAELAHKVRQAVARKRAEYSLVESEKRLTDIINFLPDATFAIDRAGTVIAWNRAIEEMTGVPAADMVGKGNFEYAIPFYGTRRKILIDLIFEPDDVIAKHYAHIHREKDVLIADTNLPRPRGKEVLLTGKASPLYDRQGKVVGAIEAIRDITQHEQDARRIAQKTSALSTINRIIQASNLRQTFDDYVQNVLSLTIDLLRYDAGGIYLLDDDGRHARIICSENLGPEFIAAVDNIDVHAAPYNTLFLEGEPVIIENLETVLPQAAAVSGFRAIASIPIVSQDRVIGAVNVASRASPLVDREDREILVAIGRELGSAIMQIRTATALQESEAYLRYMLGFYEKAEQSEDELRKYAVEGAGAVTGSPMGYLAFLNEDETVLTIYAWSKSAMAECSLREKPIVYPVEKTGLWGEAVRQRRPVITNDYAAPNPRKKGYPEGHPRIIRHMNVPIFDGDRIVLVAGVANRPSDYTDREVRELSLLMQGLWHVLKRQHVEKELRAAHEELTASDEELRGQLEELIATQEKLRESERQLTEIADTVPGVVYQFYARPDGSMGFHYVSRRVEEIFGVSSEPEQFFDRVTDNIDPRDRDKFLDSIRSAVAQGLPWHFEGRFIRPDGERIWFQGSSRPVRKGSELVYNGVLLDITARKNAEDARRASEERYRSVIEHSPYGIHFYVLKPGRQLVFTGANSGAERILKITHDQLIGKTIEEAFPGLAGTEIPERYREVAESGTIWQAEQVFYDHGEISGAYTVSAFPIAPGSIAAMFVDITERKRMEDALRQRLFALTRPLEDSDIAFKDLFNIDEIQQLQDEFAQATGVAVLLTHPDGSPITRPSNFCRLCGEIVRRTEAGRARCERSDAELGRVRHGGPFIHTCLSAGLWGAGAPIVLGGRHIANWLIGQVRNESQTEDQMRRYAREIGVDEEEFVAAFLEVPVMSSDRFAVVAQSLQTLANQLSKSAYQNVQQARFITEREKAEKALREKTEELDRYFTASLDLFCIADTNGYFRRLNPEWEKALGFSLADLEDHRFLDFVHPDDLPATLAAVATLKDQKEILNFTNRYRHKDGSYRWIEWRSFPHGDRIFAAARDITGRKQMEEELRESEERYRSLFENSSATMLLIDPDTGSIVDANPAACTYYGWSHDEITAKSIGEINTLTPDQVNAEMAAARTLKRSRFLFRHRRADGSERDVEVYSGPLRVKGRLLLYSIVIDVTERRRMEEELRAAEERLRLMIQQAPVALAMFDTGMRYIAASRRWIADYQIGDRDIIGRSHYEVFPEIPEDLKAVHRRALAGEVISASEEKFVREDGSCQWITWEVRPWFTAGNAVGGIIIFSEDITRRKEAEEALRESEVKYRTLVERAGEAITILQDGRHVYANPRIAELLGKPVSGIIGHDFLETVWPDDREVVRTRYQDRCSGKTVPETYDFRMLGPEGRPRWVSVSIADILWQGRPATLNMITDITERKLAEATLLESRAELSSILHGSPVLQFVINRHHRIVSWNKALEEYTGLSADEVVGTDQQWRPFYDQKRPVLADLLVDNNTDGLFKWYSGKLKPSRYVEGAFEATDFFPLVGATGSWLSFTAAPIRNAEGGIIGAVETLEDVTERVHAEAALRESEGKYRRILENMQDAYIRTDENGIITMVNPSAVRMFGYSSPEDMTGIPASSLYLRPGDRDELLRILRESGGVTDIAGETVRKDGTTFSVSLNVQFIRDETGQVRGTEAIVRDVSERRAMERALQEANRKLALLGSITRHDVANKVAIITGFAQAARMHTLTPEIAVYLSKIEAAGADISRQIAFTKTYQELGVNAPAWVSIPDLVGRQRAEGVAITCTCRAEVYADPMLEKVFLNLIDNAVRHGEKVTEIAVRCTTRPEGLVITVADNGAGVPDDLKEKIFERGFGKHTGFGLFLAREILAITGITIRETGTPGKGARFEMVVPEGGYRKIEDA